MKDAAAMFVGVFLGTILALGATEWYKQNCTSVPLFGSFCAFKVR